MYKLDILTDKIDCGVARILQRTSMNICEIKSNGWNMNETRMTTYIKAQLSL